MTTDDHTPPTRHTHMEKPIPFGAEYIMRPGMTYRDVCLGMRLEEHEIEAGILALELLNGPEPKPYGEKGNG